MKVHSRAAFAAAVFLCFVIWPADLCAHAVLVESTPKAGAMLTTPDVVISLQFNVRIEGNRSRCTLITPDGAAHPLPLDSQSRPDLLNAKIDGLMDGVYTLQWQVLAADGHISRGEFTFTVQSTRVSK